jgi:hypothetical protein
MSELGIDPDDRRPPSPPQSPSRKRPGRLALPLAAVAILLVVLLVAVGAVRALHLGPSFMDNPPAQVPVIAPDAGPDKSVPDNPGGMAVPDQDKIILNGDSATPKVEQLLPPPETPLPPPAASSAPPAVTLPLASPTPVTPAETAPPPAPPPIASSPASAPVTLVPPSPAPQAPPAPVIATPAPVAPPSAAATANPHPPGKGYFLQLASVRSTEEAQANWSRLKAAQPDLLGKLPANAVRVDLGERGIYYRIMAGPIAEEGSATRLCNSLKQRHVACILVRP